MEHVYSDENVFPSPGPGNVSLLDFPGQKVAFLDGWRFNRSALPYETQCRWYDGSAVSVHGRHRARGVPRNGAGIRNREA